MSAVIQSDSSESAWDFEPSDGGFSSDQTSLIRKTKAFRTLQETNHGVLELHQENKVAVTILQDPSAEETLMHKAKNVRGDTISNIKTRPPTKTRPAQSTALHSLPEAADATWGAGMPEPSASQAPLTPLDNPRRVGPASRPANYADKEAASKYSANELDCGGKHGPKDGLEQPKEKGIQLKTKGHKCPAEDVLQDSPTKHTRSKAVDLPPKRSKKPNSRYAANFICS
ncbi:uncharacterized protein F5147DRAFT_652729 [Suillus discolor]|uniref:Uncharacterized protein n=1 Tax=Suillus discolor TaxID=1912936 RepID=A0A9P7JUD9_9AGAM|nr:uncharacterized protein F5147DRAFT_652729 [Suillus discolor]KAG2108742.1 hypothetical protein F5147DRAFT_652729 [Suillus discolor]